MATASHSSSESLRWHGEPRACQELLCSAGESNPRLNNNLFVLSPAHSMGRALVIIIIRLGLKGSSVVPFNNSIRVRRQRNPRIFSVFISSAAVLERKAPHCVRYWHIPSSSFHFTDDCIPRARSREEGQVSSYIGF